MKLVVQVKLLPTAEQAAAMRSTLHACNNAAAVVSRVAFETRAFREYALRTLTYSGLKARGLGAQTSQHVIKKVADAYTTLHANIRNRDHFHCRRCGLAGPADIVAAVNIRNRARSVWVHVNVPDPVPAQEETGKCGPHARSQSRARNANDAHGTEPLELGPSRAE
ncbi:hypothetical protein SAMN04488074_105157 [Lentzea albidocapillata subsp. violacea]|uniref:Transposase n=1 Tax=Lentzea albidocapillata subsp. violacea TaxID=128104 RepID=A0A1G9AYH1_9PSEU|nr:hypothetical protein [Lentzea albidocapillata]SDK32302.1 hypothetical protein SAMN04488074_105157 [Lentzea albidocapillata subsp. violacea]